MFKFFISLGAVLALCSAGCGEDIGDACTTSSQCESGQLCDTTLPGGYCTVKQCLFTGCPESSLCVSFTDFDSYCMLLCSDDSDCRDGYSCIQETEETHFCGILSGASP
jgi:hypothetical protein